MAKDALGVQQTYLDDVPHARPRRTSQPFRAEKKNAGGKPIMIDWQSWDDDRNADPDWQADWQRGHEVGSLIIVGLLALVMAFVLLGGWETSSAG
jgi:hypothetical protein